MSSPIRNEPENTYSGIEDFRRSVLYDENAGQPVEEQKGSLKFIQKSKENPMVPIGIFGGIAAVLFSAYKYKTRDRNTKLSVYLIHTRMAAQGAVVSALTLGVLYQLYKNNFQKDTPAITTPQTLVRKNPE